MVPCVGENGPEEVHVVRRNHWLACGEGCDSYLLQTQRRSQQGVACYLVFFEVCSQGVCASSCAGELEACSGSCVDVENDPHHCGSCTKACSRVANGIATCASRVRERYEHCDVRCVMHAVRASGECKRNMRR